MIRRNKICGKRCTYLKWKKTSEEKFSKQKYKEYAAALRERLREIEAKEEDDQEVKARTRRAREAYMPAKRSPVGQCTAVPIYSLWRKPLFAN